MVIVFDSGAVGSGGACEEFQCSAALPGHPSNQFSTSSQFSPMQSTSISATNATGREH